MEQQGWTQELQSAIDERDLPEPVKALRRELNIFRKTHAVINYSGRTFIQWRDTKEGLQFQQVADFHTYNARYVHNIEYEDSKGVKRTREVSVSKEFIKDRYAKIFEGVEFAPGENSDKWLNLWKGWKVTPQAGDVSKFLDLIASICDDDKACIEYLLNYLAHTIQQPSIKPEVAVVMRGPQGIGKGTLMKLMGSFNDNYKHLSSANSLVGNFSGHLIDSYIVFADEAVWGGDKVAEGRLKAMITEDKLSIRAMHKDEIYVKSYVRLFVASNEDWVVPVGEGDRRYFVVDCSPRYKGQTEPGQFFYEFGKWVNAGGREAVFDFLNRRDISKFNPRIFPKTQARVDMQLKGIGTSARFVYELLNGTAPLGEDTMTVDGTSRRFNRNMLYADFTEWCNTRKVFPPTPDDFGKNVAKSLDFVSDDKNWRVNWSKRVNGKNEYFYKLNSVKEAMRRFAKNVLEVDPHMVFFAYDQQEETSKPMTSNVTEIKIPKQA